MVRRQTCAQARQAYTANGSPLPLNESGFVSGDEHFGHGRSGDSRLRGDGAEPAFQAPSEAHSIIIRPTSVAEAWRSRCSKQDRGSLRHRPVTAPRCSMDSDVHRIAVSSKVSAYCRWSAGTVTVVISLLA